MRLLQTSWPEVLTLSLAFRSIPVSSSSPKLQWSADFCMSEKEARDCGMDELFYQVSASSRLDQQFINRID
jgi:estrogen-related receptor ERR